MFIAQNVAREIVSQLFERIGDLHQKEGSGKIL